MQRSLIILVLTVLLTACTVEEQPAYTSKIDVIIGSGSLSESRWHVPAGEVIQVQLSNQTEEMHTWSILTPTGSWRTGAAWYSEQIAPGETRSTSFTAPAAAGEYDVVSTGADTNARLTAEIVVVQP
jgi:hypothetical protein